MMQVVEFRPVHLARMRAQSAQLAEIEHPEALAMPYGHSWTALDGEEPIACAGLIEVWDGRAYAWALLSEYAGAHLFSLTREIRSRLSRVPYRRVEMAVDAGFVAGCRWAEMLGFQLETPAPMRNYLPNGRDAWLYARTNNVIRTNFDGGHRGHAGPRLDL